MNTKELQQVADDLDSGIMVCRQTIQRVVAHALKQSDSVTNIQAPNVDSVQDMNALMDEVRKDQKAKDDVFPIRPELLRHMFERQYGPKKDFAWRTSDDKYKSAALQEAWELWQHAAAALTMHLTGVWERDEDCAKRLRAVCKLVGINDQVPAKDDDLWTNAFSVLGLIRRELKEQK